MDALWFQDWFLRTFIPSRQYYEAQLMGYIRRHGSQNESDHSRKA
jgi:hypothetical protein